VFSAISRKQIQQSIVVGILAGILAGMFGVGGGFLINDDHTRLHLQQFFQSQLQARLVTPLLITLTGTPRLHY
jgi:ABC-type spermidine/putrescine transport system permease subunit II